MNVGLLYTPVSIYQMTRGALVLFVGVFSVIFLRRRLWLYQFSLPFLPLYISTCSDIILCQDGSRSSL
jgi:drug/metabolite transporter (DMT)-like permease